MLRQAFTTSSRALSSSVRSAAPRLATPIRSQAPLATSALSRRIAPAVVARWYSAETDASKSAETDPAAAVADGAKPAEAAAEGPEAELKKKLETKEKEVLDWKDKCLRSVADFRNLQDRTQREVKTAREFAISAFAKDLVDSVDNLDRALSTVPEAKIKGDNAAAAEKSEDLKDLLALHEGLTMTESILMSTLKKHGLERFDPMGEKFNPNEQEATFMSPQEGKEDNTVFYTQQKGFKLNGRIIRAAKVGVVKNK